MESPKHLKHRPIVSANDYDKFDAQYHENTDAKALSIGHAQWGNDDISLKIWRYTGQKWSRQSEEMPIHRNLDLSILLLASLLADPKAAYSQSTLKETIDKPDEIEIVREYYEKNEHFLKPRLEQLRQLLNTFLSK